MKNNTRKIIAKLFTALRILEVVISAVVLIYSFYGLTDLRFQIIVHVIILLIWLVQGFVVCQMDWTGYAFVLIAILELLIATYGLCTLYTMTDYVIKSAAMEAGIPYIMTSLVTTISGKHITV